MLIGKSDNSDGVDDPPLLAPGTVAYIHWLDPAGRIGRRVLLDQQSRAVYSMPSLHPLMSLTDCYIIHANIGVRMLLVKGSNRPTIPPHILRLAGMFEVASSQLFDASSRSTLSGFAPCAVCSSITRGGQDALLCALCCVTFHDSCSQELSQATAKVHLGHGVLPPLPGIFLAQPEAQNRARLCALCHRLVAKMRKLPVPHMPSVSLAPQSGGRSFFSHRRD